MENWKGLNGNDQETKKNCTSFLNFSKGSIHGATGEKYYYSL